MGYGYTVFDKNKSQKGWTIVRTYGLKSYADEVTKAIRKSGKLAKVRKN